MTHGSWLRRLNIPEVSATDLMMFMGMAKLNVTYQGIADPISLCDYCARQDSAQRTNLLRHLRRHFARVPLVHMNIILLARHPFQVLSAIMRAGSVFMINLVLRCRRFAVEGRSDKAVDKEISAAPQGDVQVSVFDHPWFQPVVLLVPPQKAANTSVIADLIPRVKWAGSPEDFATVVLHRKSRPFGVMRTAVNAARPLYFTTTRSYSD